MKNVLTFLFASIVSSTALAAYQCDLKLSQNDNVVSEISVQANHGIISGGYLGLLYDEKPLSKKNKNVRKHLSVTGVIDGWDSGQKARLFVQRSHYKDSKNRFENLEGHGEFLISEVELKGEDSTSVFFEDYVLDIKCGRSEDIYSWMR